MKKAETKLYKMLRSIPDTGSTSFKKHVLELANDALKEAYLRGVKDGVDRMDAVIDQKIASKAIIDAIEHDMAEERA